MQPIKVSTPILGKTLLRSLLTLVVLVIVIILLIVFGTKKDAQNKTSVIKTDAPALKYLPAAFPNTDAPAYTVSNQSALEIKPLVNKDLHFSLNIPKNWLTKSSTEDKGIIILPPDENVTSVMEVQHFDGKIEETQARELLAQVLADKPVVQTVELSKFTLNGRRVYKADTLMRQGTLSQVIEYYFIAADGGFYVVTMGWPDTEATAMKPLLTDSISTFQVTK